MKTRQVFHGAQPLAITQLGFEVLLFLLQHPGQLVTRDQLADHAWKNKVITDATLYKQIQRLRKLFSDVGDAESMIQTVHGQGFIFTPTVSTSPPTILLQSLSQNRWVSYLLLGLVLITLFFVGWSLLSHKESNQSMLNINAVAEPMVLSVLPNTEQLSQEDKAWMASGGMSYLIERFRDNQSVKVKYLSKSQILSGDAEKNAITLTHDGEIDVALVFKVSESNNQFTAQAMLRNNNGVMAVRQFESVAIKELFDQMYEWSNNQMEADANMLSSNQMLSKDRYAVENFIRGMGAQFAGKAAQAIQYFEQATSEDAKFWKAWYELAIAYRKQGQNEKALAITETLLKTTEAEPLHLGAMNSKALTLWRLGKHDQALQVIDQVIGLAQSKQYPNIHSFFTNKAIIATELGDLILAEQAISQSINILENQEVINHRSLGSAYNTLAGVNMESGDSTQAKVHVLKAIDAFEKAGDIRYQLTAQSRLSSIYVELGELELAEQLTSSVLIEQNILGDISGQIGNWLKIANINLTHGKLEKVNKALKDVEMLLTETSNEYLSNQYHVTKIKYLQQTHQWQQIPPLLKQLQNLIINDAQQVAYLDLKLNHAYHIGDAEVFKATIDGVESSLKTHALFDYWRAKDAINLQQQAKAISAMRKASEKVMATPHNLEIRSRIFNELALLLLAQDEAEAMSVVNQCEAFNPPPYPFLKVKAQVEAARSNYFAAASLMQELKPKAHDHWTPEDQLLMESFQKQLN